MKDSSDIYYVVLRGTPRQPIFTDDEDRRHFTRVVADAALACRATVHGYCWLPLEARLAVQVADVPVSQFAQRVADRHARRLEREISLTRSHFEPQYRGVVVDGQTALPDLVRHIHLAPLKAGLAYDLMDYPWCSHRVYMGAESSPWLTTRTMLHHFEQPGRDPRRGYAAFMVQGVEELEALGAAGGARHAAASRA
jgi:hypothetical protein